MEEMVQEEEEAITKRYTKLEDLVKKLKVSKLGNLEISAKLQLFQEGMVEDA